MKKFEEAKARDLERKNEVKEEAKERDQEWKNGREEILSLMKEMREEKKGEEVDKAKRAKIDKIVQESARLEDKEMMRKKGSILKHAERTTKEKNKIEEECRKKK